MTLTIIISIVLLAAYIIGASAKLGRCPESLTELATVFEWPWRVLWFVAICGAATFAAPSAVEHSSDETMFLAYITVSAVVIYSMCARLDDGIDATITTVAGWTAIVASQLVAVINHWWVALLWIPAVVLIIIRKPSYWKFIATLTAIITFYIHCII